MTHDWQELTKLTRDEKFVVERIRLQSGIRVEGEFELPSMAALPMEDQIFIAAFIKSHGSIKQMERLFGISYPSVKSRLNKISESIDFVDIQVSPESTKAEVLERLERGEITVDEAMKELKR